MSKFLNLEKSWNVQELSSAEKQLTDGGNDGRSFWGDVAYLAGATLRCIVEFSKQAVEYQHSLPPNLKK